MYSIAYITCTPSREPPFVNIGSHCTTNFTYLLFQLTPLSTWYTEYPSLVLNRGLEVLEERKYITPNQHTICLSGQRNKHLIGVSLQWRTDSGSIYMGLIARKPV